jgi:lysozyme
VNRKHVAWVSICIGCVAGAEGLRTVAYFDPVGIPTICFGETRGVKLGDKATLEQCKDMLGVRVQEFGRGVDRCITMPMSASRKAAYTSFAYNVGVETFCRSSVAWKFNGGTRPDHATRCSCT